MLKHAAVSFLNYVEKPAAKKQANYAPKPLKPSWKTSKYILNFANKAAKNAANTDDPKDERRKEQHMLPRKQQFDCNKR